MAACFDQNFAHFLAMTLHGKYILRYAKRKVTVSTVIFISCLLSWPEDVQNSGNIFLFTYWLMYWTEDDQNLVQYNWNYHKPIS
jgi:hypothetical protein